MHRERARLRQTELYSVNTFVTLSHKEQRNPGRSCHLSFQGDASQEVLSRAVNGMLLMCEIHSSVLVTPPATQRPELGSDLRRWFETRLLVIDTYKHNLETNPVILAPHDVTRTKWYRTDFWDVQEVTTITSLIVNVSVHRVPHVTTSPRPPRPPRPPPHTQPDPSHDTPRSDAATFAPPSGPENRS
ncbi:unnamed protein product [Pleuronectes platessa]|uniref:Uncharacterized protein n=1 Tax=Pleuronectes platessa TaxID=8262 RepID=A0A9N7YG03_PLEPL|nr:unnamed protein product [Pleuronectes platessa]